MSALDMIHSVVYDKGYEDGQRAMKQAVIDAIQCIPSTMSVCLTADECTGLVRMKKRAIEEIESLEPVQPKTGHWIKVSPAGIYECSECGKTVMTADIDAYDYCHGCGVHMIGEDNG